MIVLCYLWWWVEFREAITDWWTNFLVHWTFFKWFSFAITAAKWCVALNCRAQLIHYLLFSLFVYNSTLIPRIKSSHLNSLLTVMISNCLHLGLCILRKMLHKRWVSHKRIGDVIDILLVAWFQRFQWVVCGCLSAALTAFKVTIHILGDNLLFENWEFVWTLTLLGIISPLAVRLIFLGFAALAFIGCVILETFSCFNVFFCRCFVYVIAIILRCHDLILFFGCKAVFGLLIALFVDITWVQIWWWVLLMKVENSIKLTIIVRGCCQSIIRCCRRICVHLQWWCIWEIIRQISWMLLLLLLFLRVLIFIRLASWLTFLLLRVESLLTLALC